MVRPLVWVPAPGLASVSRAVAFAGHSAAHAAGTAEQLQEGTQVLLVGLMKRTDLNRMTALQTRAQRLERWAAEERVRAR